MRENVLTVHLATSGTVPPGVQKATARFLYQARKVDAAAQQHPLRQLLVLHPHHLLANAVVTALLLPPTASQVVHGCRNGNANGMQAKVCVTAHLTNSEDARVQAPQGYNTGGRLNQLTSTEQHKNAKIKVVHLMYELDKSVSDSFLFLLWMVSTSSSTLSAHSQRRWRRYLSKWMHHMRWTRSLVK